MDANNTPKVGTVTFSDMCERIAREFQAKNVRVRNCATGRTIPDASGAYRVRDIFDFDSHGELGHIYAWFALVTSEEWKNGNIAQRIIGGGTATPGSDRETV